ncbi:flagellar protein FliT [Peribacillus frigoritolerans]|uniref:flagellar protein FliT n=1 Tax=Peribacillus frigoritolerans TaxID=450367 RepID=UPI0024C153E6|nr:flagellar protein FliT [Peribacillus frigoritolerans]WHX66878.1 flagellar protein FliT [Peribacillus frigoritolerans]
MVIRAFHDLTAELLAVLEDSTTERDVKIERVTKLIDRRDGLLSQIKPPFTGEEQQMGRAVLLLNQRVNHLLKLQKQEIQRDIQEMNKKKKSSNKYTNPYESLSVDGVFYDKRN